MHVAKSKSAQRIKLALLGSSANFASTLLNFLVFFLSVPLTISYLGEERFGVWMTVASIAGMLSFMDFGVGNGLVSQIAKSNITEKKITLQNTVTRGITILVVIGMLVGIFLTAMHWLFPVSSMLKIDSDLARQDVEFLMVIFISLFVINIPLNGLFKILLGLQKSWIVHLAKSCASLLSICLIYVLAQHEAEPGYLLLATYGMQVLVPLVVIPYFLRLKLFNFRTVPSWRNARDEYMNLMNFGGLFLVLQLGMMAGWGADALIISSLSSVSAVAQFAIVQRLFQFVSIPVAILNNPLWGAYADAHAHNDTNFIRKTLKVSLLGTLVLSTILSLIVYFGSEFILAIWIKNEVAVSGTLLLGFAFWKVLESIGHSFSMALNGLHIIKAQVVSVLLLCLMVLPLKFHFTPIYGADAVIWSTIVAYSLSTVLFYLILFRHHIVHELRG